MKWSSGTILYREGPSGWEVLLVHPSGGNKKEKWGIPKGGIESNEPAETAARRETREECGVKYDGELIHLGEVIYKSKKKRVLGYAGKVDQTCRPRVASWEIDDAKFFPLAEAEKAMHESQKEFITRLKKLLFN